ncbi:MAG: C25 family cysteine peptidase [bacterium]
MKRKTFFVVFLIAGIFMANKLYCDLKTYNIDNNGFTVTYVFDETPNLSQESLNLAVPDFANTKLELLDLQKSEFSGEIPLLCKNYQKPFEFINAGDRNSVNIAKILVNKYYKADNKVYQIQSITLRINYKLINFSEKIDNFTRSFYSDIINIEHLPYLINERNRKQGKTLQADSWFDKTKKYLKLQTYNEGVAYCSMKSLIELDPSWEGKSSANIIMLKNGNQYPFYIKDSDGKISNDDKIYFYGSFPHGDSTYYNFYEAKQAYFLYLSESEIGSRLQLLQEPATVQADIKSVSVSRHIETPFNFTFTENYEMDDEWNKCYYEQKISPDSNNRMNKYNGFFYTQPTSELEDKVNIKLNWQTEKDTIRYSSQIRKYLTNYYVNNNLQNTLDLTGRYFSKDITSYNSNELVNGMNSVSLILANRKDISQGSVLIKSLDISGKEIPLAQFGKTSFSIDKLAQNSKIEIPGFQTQAIAIDTLNQTIAFPMSFKADFLSAGSIAKNIKILSTTINNKTYYLDSTGILISYYDQAMDSLVSNYYKVDDYKILDCLDKASRKPLSIACNMTQILSTNIIDKIRTMTGADLSQAGGIPWSLIYSANDCKLSSNASIANVYGIFTNNSSNYQKATLNLAADKSYSFYMNDETTVEEVEPTSVNQSQLKFNDQQADVLILSHRNFLNAAKRLADYRRQQTGLTIKVIDVDDIYNEFNYGRQAPQPIKEFLQFAYNNWRTPQPRYLILFGDANCDHRRLLKGTTDNNFLPVYGMPYSDYWYSNLTNNIDVINLITGRLPVNTTEQSELMVDKLIKYDQEPQSPWMKRFLFVSGGLAETELHDFFSWTDEFIKIVIPKPFGADTSLVRKTELGVTESDGSKVIDQINQGAAWTNFIGHGASDVFDLDGWNVEFLSNTNKYGVLTTLSCNTGNFALPNFPVSRNESYLLSPRSGHIAAIGSAAGSFVTETSWLLMDFLKSISDPNIKLRRIGDIYNYGKNKNKTSWGNSYRITKIYVHLLGDPLTRLRIAEDIDLYLTKSDMEVHPETEGKTILETNNFVKFKAKIHNAGYCTSDSIDVLITRQYADKIDTYTVKIAPLCLADSFSVYLPIKDMSGKHNVTVTIDPNRLISETNVENNTTTAEFDVFKEGLLPLEPFPYWNISSKNPIIRVINPISKENQFIYSFEITEYENGIEKDVTQSKETEIKIDENFIEWHPSVKLDNDKIYVIKAKSKVVGGDTESDWLTIPIKTQETLEKNQTRMEFDNDIHFNNFTLNNLSVQNNRIYINDKDYPYHLISYCPPAGGAYPYIYMNVGGPIYIVGQYHIGIALVTIPVAENETQGKVRFYDTWVHSDEPDWYKTTTGPALVKFLKDSVRDDEYLFVASSGQAWRVPILIEKLVPKNAPERVGGLDSLQFYLNKYGSSLIDSTDGPEIDYWWGGWRYSFDMFGRKGLMPGQAHELIDSTLDTVKLDGYYTRFLKSGNFATPKYGPARTWGSFEIGGFANFALTKWIFDVYGYDKAGSRVLLKSDTNKTSIDISDISAKEYPYISLEGFLFRQSIDLESSKPENRIYIDNISCNFIPSPEIAVKESSITLNQSEFLRGDKLKLQFSVQNIALRSDALENQVYVRFGKDAILDSIIKLDQFDANEIKEFAYSTYTDNFNGENKIDIFTNYGDITNENYYFNNNAGTSFKINVDTIKPEIDLLVDGKHVAEGDYVTEQPTIEITISDNSPLAITDSSKINVFINGIHQPDPTTVKYKFISYGRGGDLKAKIELIPPKLLYGDNALLGANTIRIIAEDPNGNISTLLVRVNVSLNLFVTDAINFPNPASDVTNFVYNIKAPLNEGQARIEIYNYSGKPVKTLIKPIVIGKNIIEWDCHDTEGRLIPQGAYFYKIYLDSESWAEPADGNFMFVR